MALGHCPKCGKEWGAMGEAHCPSCHLQFGSDSAFLRHRVGDIDHRHCMTESEMLKPRERSGKPSLVSTVRGSGTVWVSSLYERGVLRPDDTSSRASGQRSGWS